MNTDQLLAAARAHASIISLRGIKAQGAEGYLQAVVYVHDSNRRLTSHEIFDMAYSYLEVTVDREWQRRRYFEGAETARKVLRRLQS